MTLITADMKQIDLDPSKNGKTGITLRPIAQNGVLLNCCILKLLL